MVRGIIFFFSIVFYNNVSAQKYDYQWILGYGKSKEYKFGITLLDFNNDDVDTSYYCKSPDYNLDFRGSFIN